MVFVPVTSPVNVAPVITGFAGVIKKSSAVSISVTGPASGRLAAAIKLVVFPVLKITGSAAFAGRLKAAQANKNGAETMIFLMAHLQCASPFI